MNSDGVAFAKSQTEMRKRGVDPMSITSGRGESLSFPHPAGSRILPASLTGEAKAAWVMCRARTERKTINEKNDTNQNPIADFVPDNTCPYMMRDLGWQPGSRSFVRSYKS